MVKKWSETYEQNIFNSVLWAIAIAITSTTYHWILGLVIWHVTTEITYKGGAITIIHKEVASYYYSVWCIAFS